jgi:monoamine oxidase
MLDVIILGAGAAGLRAAQVLHNEYGRSVAVVEARPTAGGRIRWTTLPSGSGGGTTSDDNNADGLYIDEGAQFIHGLSRNHPIQSIAKDKQISYRRIDWDDGYYFCGPNRQELASAVEEREQKAVGKTLNDVWLWQQTATTDTSLHSVIEPLVQKYCAKDTRLSPLRIWAELEMRIAEDYGDDLDKQSARFYNQDDALGDEDAVPHNYEKLVQALLPEEENDDMTIHYNRVVQNVNLENANYVTVNCKDAGTQEMVTFQARRIICTLPLGVLKQQATSLFTPPLPSDKELALQRQGFGCLEKVWLQFTCPPFWPRDTDAFYHVASATPFRAWFLPERVYRNPAYRQTLCCFVAGDAARLLGNFDSQQVADQAVAALRQIFNIPEVDNLLKAVHVTRWSTDPWSGGGSYSFTAVGSTPEDYRVWEHPSHNGRLWFAGEATNAAYVGTVHGAYWSGERAAKGCQATL